jgi:6-pyruvoyltetrahydropterin/6-carboxytetrahydropterin synthase
MSGAEISKTFRFAASHRLDNLPEGHKCLRLHGHNYEVTLFFAAPALNEAGMVADYATMDQFRDWIDNELDHRHLGIGDVYDEDGNLTDPAMMTGIPTAENLAVMLFKVAASMYGSLVTSVLVKETGNTSATIP